MLATTSAARPEPPRYPAMRIDRSGEPFLVRPYRMEDRAPLTRFYEEFEPKRAAQGLPPVGQERVARWLGGVLDQGLHLVAFRGELLMGHAFVVHAKAPGTGEYAVFLSQSERGRGVGTELNRLAVEAARGSGFARLWLSAEPHNRPAIRSYENAGFRFRPETIYSIELEMELDL